MAKAFVLGEAPLPSSLGLYLDLAEEPPTAGWSVEDALQAYEAQRFTASEASIPNYGVNPAVQWAHFIIHNPKEENVNVTLVNFFHWTDKTTVFQWVSQNRWLETSIGDQTRFRERPIKTRTSAFPIRLHPGDNRFMIRVSAQGALQLDLRLYEPESYRDYNVVESLFIGLLFGFHIVVAFYNLFLYRSFQDRTYIHYFLYVMANVSYQGFSLCVAHLVLYSLLGISEVPGQMAIISVDAVVITALLFSDRFLDIKTYMPKFHRLNKCMMIWAVINMVITQFNLYLGAVICILDATITISLLLFQGFYCLSKGHPTAKYFTIAWGAYLVGSTATVVNLGGLIPSNSWTYWGQFVGGSLEIVILSLALANRINFLQGRLSRSLHHQEQVEGMLRHSQFLEERLDENGRKNFQYAYCSRTADSIGGDFLGIKITEQNEAFIIIGDVTGHGIESAMLSVVASGIIRGAIGEQSLNLQGVPLDQRVLRIMETLNQTILDICKKYDRSMTVCILAIDLETGLGHYCNGGHTPFVWKKGDSSLCLVNRGSMVGLLEEPQFSVSDIQLQDKDMIIMITDGLIENVGHSRRLYTFKDIQKHTEDSSSPYQLRDRIEIDLQDHWQDIHLEDDSTYIIFQMDRNTNQAA
ncbi:SpoIIE family protein phosphatase [Pseudobacteriovorax antillogorgiicola]|nr:SpoIIE family protein phosphatase [Pseudobacteriovorax antillogorgiicola]